MFCADNVMYLVRDMATIVFCIGVITGACIALLAVRL